MDGLDVLDPERCSSLEKSTLVHETSLERRTRHPVRIATFVRIVDLSTPIAPSAPDASPLVCVEIEYADHAGIRSGSLRIDRGSLAAIGDFA